MAHWAFIIGLYIAEANGIIIPKGCFTATWILFGAMLLSDWLGGEKVIHLPHRMRMVQNAFNAGFEAGMNGAPVDHTGLFLLLGVLLLIFVVGCLIT